MSEHLFYIPDKLPPRDPDQDDKFYRELLAAMMTPIDDEDSPPSCLDLQSPNPYA